jgi:hypothetical protein
MPERCSGEPIVEAATPILSLYNPRIPFLLLIIINVITIDSSIRSAKMPISCTSLADSKMVRIVMKVMMSVMIK